MYNIHRAIHLCVHVCKHFTYVDTDGRFYTIIVMYPLLNHQVFVLSVADLPNLLFLGSLPLCWVRVYCNGSQSGLYGPLGAVRLPRRALGGKGLAGGAGGGPL
jgi:hypothetical protein